MQGFIFLFVYLFLGLYGLFSLIFFSFKMLFKRRKCLCNMNLLVYFIFLMSFFKKTFGFERKCAFAVSSQSNPNSQFNVTYNDETFECVQCANGNTNLLNKRQNWYQEGVCRSESCNGVVCTSKCIPISQFSSPKNPIAVLSVCRSGNLELDHIVMF